MILAPEKMSLLRKSSRITLKMSIFHRRFDDRSFLRHRVILWSITAAEEAWVEGQISRYSRVVQSINVHHLPHPPSELSPCFLRFWKSLKDRGLWQHELYIHRKTSAGLSEVELRELMPQCVLDDTRKCYPNPHTWGTNAHRCSM